MRISAGTRAAHEWLEESSHSQGWTPKLLLLEGVFYTYICTGQFFKTLDDKTQTLKLKHGTSGPRNYTELHVTQLNAPHYIGFLEKTTSQKLVFIHRIIDGSQKLLKLSLR